jgi:hypothetical protein
MLISQWVREDGAWHGGGMGDRQLRQRCEQTVKSLELPAQFDVHELARVLGQRFGRPIRLISMALPLNSPCGMWVRTGEFDAVFYEADTSPLHQMLIIGHEFGHILAGHRASQTLGPEASRLLLPALDPQLVKRYLGRSNYSRTEEREAEMIASLLVQRAARIRSDTEAASHATPDRSSGEVVEALSRLEETLIHRNRGHHG